MLQRRVLQRPQCILCLRRYASFYTGFGPNPATSLLTTNSESTTSSTPSKKGEAEDDPEIVVLNRRTGKRASVKMSKVKPFEGDYGILPLAQRLEVERRELLKTLRERQEGDVWKKVQQDLENAKKKDELKKLDVTEDRIDMRVRRMLMKRRAVTSVMPSEAKVRQYIRYARELEKRRLLRLRTRENEQQQKPQQKNQQKGQQKDEDKKEETPNTQTLSFKEQWERRQLYAERILNPMKQGAFVNRYSPYRDLKNPVRPRHATVEQLLAAGCHIGHNKSVCHPAMKPFIFGLHGDIHIINLDHTLSALRRACTIVREISFRRGIILVVGSRKGLKPLVVATAERMDGFVLSRPWIPGTITNASHVLFRGKVDAETIRFKQYWPLSERHRSKFEKLFDERIMERMVYDRNVGQWVTSDEMVPEFRDWKGQFRGGSERKNSTGSSRRNFRGSQRRHSRGSQRRHSRESQRRTSTASGSKFQPNLAPLMAWEKFASMVQSISDFSADIFYGPQSQLQSKIKELSVESVSNYIPDHGDNWYIRELNREGEEVELRHMVEAENGDRNILEIHAMNKFLAKGKFRGKVRGRAIESMKVELAGDPGHPEVKVFRDGSVIIGGRRFNAQGVPLRQYSDGSYEMHGQRYDIDGMRYDPGQEAFVFSDGSKLLLEGEPPDRKLMVVMGETMFDVTSTVVGSAQKREIIEKALDLELAATLSQRSNDVKETETEEGTLVEDHASVYLGGPSQDVRYHVKIQKRMQLLGEQGTDGQEDPTVTKEELVYMTADELVDIDDNMSALSLDGEIDEGPSRKRAGRNVQSNMESPPTLVGNTSSPETVSPVRPDLIIFLNSRENTVAIREAASTHIPTIGIVDTDTDPQGLAYSIPGNDDSFRSLEYLAGVLSRAGEEGKIHREQYLKQLDNLQSRAVAVMQGAWKDYDVLRECERLERLQRNIKAMELELKRSGRHGKLLEQFERNLKDLENFETVKAATRDIVEKYCRWYRFERDTASLELIKKIISNHILLGQRELHRLDADTTGWSMEDFLAQVKTSTEMPGIPIGALENLALDQLTASRHAWAEARDEARSRALMSAKNPPQLEV